MEIGRLKISEKGKNLAANAVFPAQRYNFQSIFQYGSNFFLDGFRPVVGFLNMKEVIYLQIKG